MDTTVKLSSTQLLALKAFAALCGSDSECWSKPKGVRSTTVSALVAEGLMSKKWHTIGRVTEYRVTDAGRAMLSAVEAK